MRDERFARSWAVVDRLGRVHGIGALRVIDASIIPDPLSGFPNLIAMIVAERISSTMIGASTAGAI